MSSQALEENKSVFGNRVISEGLLATPFFICNCARLHPVRSAKG
jgi:hypothetical protein